MTPEHTYSPMNDPSGARMKSSLAMLPIETRFAGSQTSTITRRFNFLPSSQKICVSDELPVGSSQHLLMRGLALGGNEILVRQLTKPRDLRRDPLARLRLIWILHGDQGNGRPAWAGVRE